MRHECRNSQFSESSMVWAAGKFFEARLSSLLQVPSAVSPENSSLIYCFALYYQQYYRMCGIHN